MEHDDIRQQKGASMTDPNYNPYDSSPTSGDPNASAPQSAPQVPQNTQSYAGEQPYASQTNAEYTPAQPYADPNAAYAPAGAQPYADGGNATGQPQNMQYAPQGTPYATPDGTYDAPQYSAPQYEAPQYGAPNGVPNTGAYGAPQYGAPQYAAYADDASGATVPLDKPYYGCSLPEAFLRFWKKYVVFTGRASRSEYWWWALCAAIVAIVLQIITHGGENSLTFLSTLWGIATLVPGLALAVRRLHDTNKPGWWLIIIYGVAVLGVIIMLVGGGAFFLGAIASYGGGDYSGTAAGGLGVFVLGALVCLVGFIVNIVLMALPSKPEGARFDADAFPQQPAMPTMPMQQQPMQQPGAPMPNGMPMQQAPQAQPTDYNTPQSPYGYAAQPANTSTPTYDMPQQPAPYTPPQDQQNIQGPTSNQ